MQTLKWCMVFVLTAVAVFAAVLLYNSKAEPAYIAKVHAQNQALSVHPTAQSVLSNVNRALASHKVKNTNL
ncbi:MAG TPA: hypothetical protein VGN23_14600 [Verrucomicrobiae bacterium]|jgi:hypothetical protein